MVVVGVSVRLCVLLSCLFVCIRKGKGVRASFFFFFFTEPLELVSVLF